MPAKIVRKKPQEGDSHRTLATVCNAGGSHSPSTCLSVEVAPQGKYDQKKEDGEVAGRASLNTLARGQVPPHRRQKSWRYCLDGKFVEALSPMCKIAIFGTEWMLQAVGVPRAFDITVHASRVKTRFMDWVDLR